MRFSSICSSPFNCSLQWLVERLGLLLQQPSGLVGIQTLYYRPWVEYDLIELHSSNFEIRFQTSICGKRVPSGPPCTCLVESSEWSLITIVPPNLLSVICMNECLPGGEELTHIALFGVSSESTIYLPHLHSWHPLGICNGGSQKILLENIFFTSALRCGELHYTSDDRQPGHPLLIQLILSVAFFLHAGG